MAFDTLHFNGTESAEDVLSLAIQDFERQLNLCRPTDYPPVIMWAELLVGGCGEGGADYAFRITK